MDLNDLMSNLSSLNVNGKTSYGVYAPSDATVKMVPNNTIPGLAGVVQGSDPKTALVGQKMSSGWADGLNTMFHELAHTAQDRLSFPLAPMGLGRYAPMWGTTFEDYASNQTTPHPWETLATLRAKDAMQKTGKTVWDTEMGQDYLDNFIAKNPNYTRDGARKYLETQMFPEHQIMTDDKDFVPGQPSLLSRLTNFLQQDSNNYLWKQNQ